MAKLQEDLKCASEGALSERRVAEKLVASLRGEKEGLLRSAAAKAKEAKQQERLAVEKARAEAAASTRLLKEAVGNREMAEQQQRREKEAALGALGKCRDDLHRAECLVAAMESHVTCLTRKLQDAYNLADKVFTDAQSEQRLTEATLTSEMDQVG